MLNVIYYPVSAILWVWHKIFGAVLGADNGIAWALSVVFLVFTLRAILYKPFVKQIKTQRQMQELQPQIKALQKKYAGDRQKLGLEMQKLQKEHGFNPVGGCLPVLLQAPVFIGLFHVLRSFNRTGTVANVPFLSPTEPMSVEQNANTPNYFFGVDDVQSFLSARLFGAPISAHITSPADQLQAFNPTPESIRVSLGPVTSIVPSVVWVAVPLMLIASVATHFTARASVARQSASATAAAAPNQALIQKLTLWVFPLFVFFGGPFLPVAILLYWLSNNAWTLVQQHYVFGKIAKEDEAKKAEVLERRAVNAPKPGAKPVNTKKKRAGQGVGTGEGPTIEDTAVADAPSSAIELTKDGGAPSGGATASGSAAGSKKKKSGGGRPSAAFDASLGAAAPTKAGGAPKGGGGRTRPAKQTTARPKRKRR